MKASGPSGQAMQIKGSDMEIGVRHRQHSERSVRENLRTWVGEPPGRAEGGRRTRPAPEPLPSGLPTAPSTRGTEPTATRCDGHEPDIAQLATSLLKALAEMLTGRRIVVFDPSELNTDDAMEAAEASVDTPRETLAGFGRSGFGIVYERVERVEQAQSLAFSARGQVTTADGRAIRFEVNLSLDSHLVRESRTEIRAGDAAMEDPLVLNFDGRGASLLAERMRFDLDADGSAESVARLTAGSGYLVLDRNGNGQVDDGRELFGPTSGNGFDELAALDGDGNGWIDEADPAFERLQIWHPDGALQGLAEAGVGAIRTASARTPFALQDGEGHTLGALRSSAVYLNEDGSAGLVQQIDLAV